jgi:hypothetical protein
MTLKPNIMAVSAQNYQDELSPMAHRLVRRILYHWTEVAAGRGFPSVVDIDPWMIGDDWKNCLLIELHTPLTRSRLLNVGNNLLSDPDRPTQPNTIGECPEDTLAGMLVARVPDVLLARDYVLDEGGARLQDRMILYRSILLPLSVNSGDIDHVLAAANYRFA